MSDLKQGAMPGSSAEWSLNLLQMAMNISNLPYHARAERSTSLLQDIRTDPRFMAIGGVYYAVAPTFADGDAVVASFTVDGKLMADVTGSSVSPPAFTDKYYIEVIATNVDQTFVIPFEAEMIIIANRDTINECHFNYDAPATNLTDRVDSYETFSDNFKTNNVHLVCDTTAPAKTAVVRIYARGV